MFVATNYAMQVSQHLGFAWRLAWLSFGMIGTSFLRKIHDFSIAYMNIQYESTML